MRNGEVFQTIGDGGERFYVIVGRGPTNGTVRCIEITPTNRITPVARECVFGIGGLLSMNRQEVERDAA